MKILGIETSCDETAAAVVEDGRVIRSNVVRTQFDLHGRYGGVVPELASRRHVEVIVPVVEEALNQAGLDLAQLDGLAVTQGPGLVGSLLVGLNFAKSLALATGLPVVGVNHLEGHIAAGFLTGDIPGFPLAALVVSGGHTNLYLVRGPMEFELYGQTRDDAAGEAFDKVAKLLGLAYPGGVSIEAQSSRGDGQRFKLPRPMWGQGLDFSFSGLKTAVLTLVNREFEGGEIGPKDMADLTASFQAAVVEVLTGKTSALLDQIKVKGLIMAGGVAANQCLRTEMTEVVKRYDVPFILPPINLCTDNGAMIAAAGYYHLAAGHFLDLAADAYSRVPKPISA
ncbi:MAG: tRNA (adenosine(37)-N6)-threonylcarbamoyltransferase complex transferase subunit TsaD [Deltaproteobacteria bacterium]|nr:tRNA (adenosine(37)-N6)-threonylcarbamoyltransferase complex transferase subunit TsaD [Deltaproteobacteria bacterium]MBW2050943.1 tRNA (adenosine(37)-N6)-threonylcarbamoyltransferase complex transferase subunit TsaD [Deltaproteobacteria bacterium]MBW2139614.1 tRNA (adenosine(37)-N6)-threonylcarbamoyltransferase complex transferase subunit TsaD [Deltaproteobacteria bacterium]MBW2322274.1 tRNA (adenosine(37)-N6)-threonylcarbamoyltransferase complex transferase subunit TsaD [Deltaproteobacteria 